jgi:hypothetical protein
MGRCFSRLELYLGILRAVAEVVPFISKHDPREQILTGAF